LVIKTLDPYPDPDSLEILDPDSMNPDLQLLEKAIFEDDSSDLLSTLKFNFNIRTWTQRLDWIQSRSRNRVANVFRNILTRELPIK
jgi:hypothetical protein